MPKRIDKLTPEQEARMPEWRDKWIEIGLRTGHADRARFEAGARACYEATNLTPPERIVWTTSPLALALAAPMAAYLLALRAGRGAVDDAVDVAVDDAVRGAVDDAVDGAVRVAVGDAVDDAVDVAVGGAVRGAVDDAVDVAVGGAVRVAVGDAVGGARKTINDCWWRLFGGQFWVGWWYGPARVSFFTDVCGLDLPPQIATAARAYRETCESACWWWPHRDFVMVCERPIHIRRDDRGRLHCEDETAIQWPDGWGLYMWHGVRVPAHVITAPATITVAQIEGEQNAEVRRVMIQRYGMARYLSDSGAKQISETERGTLYRKELAGDEPIVMVKVRNSTPEPDGSVKDYFLRVPPTMTNASEAVAWLCGKTAETYRPEVET
jgi:hypothetical protein